MEYVQPLVSVLMTCYNREKYIGEAIESVLASTYKNFELIIVDDNSNDNTVTIARQYEKTDSRIKVYENEKNLTDYINRNKAASYAKGKYIKYLDSDDIIYPHGLYVFVTSMEEFPAAAFGLCCHYDKLIPYPVCIGPHKIYIEHFQDFGHFNRAPGSAIIRRDIFEAIGGFSGKRWISDAELWLKLASKYDMVKINPGLYWARYHSDQEGNIYKKETNDAGVKLIKDYMNSRDCPLSKTEIKSIGKMLFRKRIKLMLARFFSRI